MLRQSVYWNIWMFVKPIGCRLYSSGKSFKVAVVGAAGGIGQPLSLLLRRNPLVSKLSLFDLKRAVGVAADISHVDALGPTYGFEGMENLPKALSCAEIVVVSAGMPRKPGQTRDDLFKVNADVVASVAEEVARICPKAFFAIITNPVNSTVPVAAEVLRKHDVYDPTRLFGITSLDIIRSRKFIGDNMSIDPKTLKIPVVGGHSASTIIPVISNCEPEFKGDDDEIVKISERIRNAGTEVVEAKASAGSATLSMAYAGAEFVNSLLKALSGDSEVKDTAYVESTLTEARFFASEVLLGPQGISGFSKLPQFSNYEKQLICSALPILFEDIKKGSEHGKAFQKPAPEAECKTNGQQK